jgi:hypothetical protein
MNLDAMLVPFLTWTFIATSLVINASLIYARRFVSSASPATLEQRWFKSLLTIANPLLGALVAFIPGFLYGNRFVDRLFVGLCAGFLSHFTYSLIIKRLTKKASSTNPPETQK